MRARIVGRVVGLYRYPVKSMRGTAVHSAKLWWHGLEGDRRYAFVRARDQSRFPWLTAREIPALLTYRPSFADPHAPATSPVFVTTPDNRSVPISDAQLQHELEALADEPLHLLHLG